MANITKIADQKYLIRVSKGSGKNRTFLNITFRGTLSKARELAREKESLLDAGISPDSALTFERYFQMWLKAIKSRVSPRTLDGYKGYIERYAMQSLSRFRLSDIKPIHVQTIYIDIRKSPTTVRNLHAAMRACFSYAVKKEILKKNPCKGLDLPAKSRKEIIVLTPEEAFHLVSVCREMPNGLIFEFALETGMRPEEYLALRWKDLQGSSVSVQQIVSFNRSGGSFYFSKPKTTKSRRLIPISESLRQRLVSHRREQNEHRLAMRGTWFNNDLVFPNTVGNPWPLYNLTRRYFAPILEKCDFGKHVTLYSLRHSCATLLLISGENPKVVADRLGHASVVMTLDTYSHVLPHIQANATKTMDNILRMKG
jgi:integrase